MLIITPKIKSCFISSLFCGKCYLVLLFVFNALTGISQNNPDSFETAGAKAENLIIRANETIDKTPIEARHFAFEAMKLAENHNLPDVEISANNILSEVYIYLTEYQKAMEFAVKAKEEAENRNNEQELIRAMLNIGTICNDLGNYETGSVYLMDGLKRSEKSNNKKYTAKALNSIGLLYHNQQNYDKALEYYSKAKSLYLEIGDQAGIAKGLNNIAAIYGIKGETAKARSYLFEALRLNLQKNDLDMAGINYLNLGYYYQENKQNDSAIICFEKASDIYKNIGKPSGIVRTHVFLAEYYLAIGNHDEAQNFAKEAMKGATELGMKKLMFETATLLNQILVKKGDSLMALKYQVQQLQMKDSLNIEEKQSELTRLELQYSFEKAEQQRQLEQQRKKLITLLVWISFIFAIIFIIMLWIRAKLKAKAILLEKENLSIDLELRSKEMTSNAMNLMKKNEALTKIAARLKTLQKEAKEDETRTALSKIRIELNKLVDDGGWEEFEVRFTQVHTDFYNRLLSQFPDLSPQEQRLSAFLRLNMTTKEISDLTGQSITALEMSRTRLRKKLGLTNTSANLVTFLNQF